MNCFEVQSQCGHRDLEMEHETWQWVAVGIYNCSSKQTKLTTVNSWQNGMVIFSSSSYNIMKPFFLLVVLIFLSMGRRDVTFPPEWTRDGQFFHKNSSRNHPGNYLGFFPSTSDQFVLHFICTLGSIFVKMFRFHDS